METIILVNSFVSFLSFRKNLFFSSRLTLLPSVLTNLLVTKRGIVQVTLKKLCPILTYQCSTHGVHRH